MHQQEQDLALNNLQEFMHPKTQRTNLKNSNYNNNKKGNLLWNFCP